MLSRIYTLLKLSLFVLLALLVVISLIFFLTLVPGRTIHYTNQNTAQSITALKRESPPLPIHLKIPSINVDASVEYVGLTSEGAMDIPNNPDLVGWFDLGPHPGENGNAVIAGHSGMKDNVPAAFDNLKKIKKGDQIYIENGRGETTIFIVKEIKLYRKDDDASEVFDPSDDSSHLNLITCAGIWDTIEQTSSDRLVVFTDKM